MYIQGVPEVVYLPNVKIRNAFQWEIFKGGQSSGRSENSVWNTVVIDWIIPPPDSEIIPNPLWPLSGYRCVEIISNYEINTDLTKRHRSLRHWPRNKHCYASLLADWLRLDPLRCWELCSTIAHRRVRYDPCSRAANFWSRRSLWVESFNACL